MKKSKILLVMLALISLSSVMMAQTVIYVEPNSTHRVMCWNNLHETLDIDCNINLNGDHNGNNQDTVYIPIGTSFYMEAGSEGDYMSYEWMGGVWTTYTVTIEDEGSWEISKLSNLTGYTYVGDFWVKFYDPNSVVNPTDEIDINIYPNPVTDYLIIDSKRDMQWDLMSISGQVLIRGSDERIDVSSLPSGCYLIQIETDEGVLTKKILK